MATPNDSPGRRQRFVLYAANGRVYCSNVDQKLIDLGALTQQDGSWCWLLDGNKRSGGGFFTAQEALRDLSRHLGFLWLDGQFTAVADARDQALDLDGAERLELELDELAPGEAARDATV